MSVVSFHPMLLHIYLFLCVDLALVSTLDVTSGRAVIHQASASCSKDVHPYRDFEGVGAVCYSC